MSIFGGASGGNISGIEGDLSNIANAAEGYASQAAGLEPNFLTEQGTFNQQGQDIYNLAFPQYQAGAQGQVTPAQQAAINQTLQQQNLATSTNYGNFGLGGSTMETQDLNANAAKSLAQSQAFSSLDETLGLSGLQQGALPYENAGLSALGGALGTLTGAGQILGGATGALQQAGSLAAGEQQTQLGLLGGLGSALGGSQGLFGSTGLLGSLFGGGGGSGLSSAAALGTGGLF